MAAEHFGADHFTSSCAIATEPHRSRRGRRLANAFGRTWSAPIAGVELLDLRRVLLGDRLAPELHRRCELVPSRLPELPHDLEPLDLLDACEIVVRACHRGGDLVDDLGGRRDL